MNVTLIRHMAHNTQSDRHNLKPHAFGMTGILILQYLLGIVTTFFVKFPEGVNGKQLWAFSVQQVPLALHIILGFLLLFGTIALLVRAIQLKNKTWIIASSVALAATLAAVASGTGFITAQADSYSFVMAIGFIVALCAYFWGLYTERPLHSINKTSH